MEPLQVEGILEMIKFQADLLGHTIGLSHLQLWAPLPINKTEKVKIQKETQMIGSTKGSLINYVMPQGGHSGQFCKKTHIIIFNCKNIVSACLTCLDTRLHIPT